MLKIKVRYGIDMRLWKYSAPKEQEKPDEAMFTELLSYIAKTFSFTDTKQFRITYQDEDDEMLTIASLDDFQDAVHSAQQQQKKSLKLHIVNAVEAAPNTGNTTTNSHDMHTDMELDEGDEHNDEKKDGDDNNDSAAVQSSLADKNEHGNEQEKVPSTEELDAFFSDEFVMDLLSDLFVTVFEALQESQFEISFIECIQGIVMSDDGKYDKVTSNAVWPYFMEVLLPMHAPKMEQFVVPMLKMNAGAMNASMIKQWIPTILGMMRMHIVNQQRRGHDHGHAADAEVHGHGHGGRGGFDHGWRGRGGRGRGGWPWRAHRGGWWNRGAFGPPAPMHGYDAFVPPVPMEHDQQQHHDHVHAPHHHGHQHHHHGHHHHHHRGRHHQRGWRGRRGAGWRGGHRGAFNAWAPAYHQDEGAAEEEVNGNGNNVEPEEEMQDDQEFVYTEELVAIMNMGFGDMAKVKRLLIEHRGNKENVVQELVLTKN